MMASFLIFGFIILWIRAIDQNKILRMSSYIATSVGPLFCLSILFGSTILLPKVIFIAAMYSFVTLTLFTLYGSFVYMESIHFSGQTWEDLAGFGKTNTWQGITYLTALASIAGIPGTFGYFVKLSLIAPLKDSLFFSGSIFLSIAVGAACAMRIFVFSFAKDSHTLPKERSTKPHISIIGAAFILIALGFFPFVH
jgi:NADH:ubiquinone oxidoreductase subunit 2 (subunit N)